MPIRLSDGLEVRDLQAAARAAGKVELLVDGLDEAEAIIAHVRAVDSAATGGDTAQALQFIKWRGFAGRVHQAGREPAGADGERFVEQVLHRIELGIAERPETISGNND